MPWTLVASASAAGTTSGINTTGATLLVAVAGAEAFGSETGVSDSRGNTWTALTRAGSGDLGARIWYCVNPSVGSGHTFSASASYRAIAVTAWSGNAASPFDVEIAGARGSSPVSAGNITPSENGALIIAAIGLGGTTSSTSVGSGFTTGPKIEGLSGTRYGAAIGYLEQATAATVNPAWTYTGGSNNGAPAAAVFKAAAGPTVPTLSAARIESTAAVRSPTVARLATASVAPARIGPGSSVAAPAVARVAVASVSPGRIASTAAVYSPTVARVAAAAVAPARIGPTSSVAIPVLTRVALASVQATRIESTSAVRAPAVSADGMAAVGAPRIESTAVVRSPSVTAAGVRSLAPARIEPTSVVAAPVVERASVVSVSPGRIDSATSFGVPTVTATNVPQIVVGRVESTAVVRSPLVQRVGAGGGADPAEVWSYVMANGRTAEQNVLDNNRMLRIVLAALSGQTAGIGTATETYFGEDGVTPRLVATFDSAGNRVSVLTDGAP